MGGPPAAALDRFHGGLTLAVRMTFCPFVQHHGREIR